MSKASSPGFVNFLRRRSVERLGHAGATVAGIVAKTGIPRLDVLEYLKLCKIPILESLSLRLLSHLDRHARPLPTPDLVRAVTLPESDFYERCSRVNESLSGLDPLVKRMVARTGTRPARLCYWISETGLPMDFEDAKQMVLRGVPFGEVFLLLDPQYHELFKRWYTDEARVPNLVARTACPVQDGKSCQRCGGFLVRTGTCETCQSCGDNSGCG